MSWIDRLRRKGPNSLNKINVYEMISRLERESHGSRATYVGNNRVIVKCVVKGANIAYYVEANDRLISPWFIVTGHYETDLTNYFLRSFKPNSHCIDVGANFGYFTCLMARFCPKGRVIGIEADKHIYEIVRDNIAINGFGHAEAIHAAASSSSGEITFFRRHSRSGNTSIVSVGTDLTELLGERPAEPFDVGAIRIDDLSEKLGGRVDLMKIDVEGAEPLAIEGSRQTIASNPQLAIVMEWSPGQIQSAGFDLRDFLDSLQGQGIRPFDLENDREVLISYDELLNLPYRAGIVLKR